MARWLDMDVTYEGAPHMAPRVAVTVSSTVFLYCALHPCACLVSKKKAKSELFLSPGLPQGSAGSLSGPVNILSLSKTSLFLHRSFFSHSLFKSTTSQCHFSW